MTPRSRTGKLMQGLWGRFGNKNPEQPPIEPNSYRQQETPTSFDLDESEFPSAQIFDVDDEQTNWDDTETLADEQNLIVYSQPIVPAVAPPSPKPPTTRTPTVNPAIELDDWDDALPAPTVKNGDRQQTRRSKKVAPVSTDEDMWAEDVPTGTDSGSDASISTNNVDRDRPDRLGNAVGLWSAMLGQLRRILPPPLRQLSDAILTAILVMLVTLGIWIVDGLFAPPQAPTTATKPPAIVERSPVQPEAEPPSDLAASTVEESRSPNQPATETATAPAAEEPESPDPTAVAPPSEPSETTERPTTPVPPTAQPAPSPIAKKVSPDREFIDAIADRVNELTREYPDHMIAGLDVDVARSRAIVTLDPIWQTLSTDDFDRLLDRMWQQAKTNHFNKLEIRNPQGTIIARSPVVGDRMIVLEQGLGNLGTISGALIPASATILIPNP